MAIETKKKILISFYIDKETYLKIKNLAKIGEVSNAYKINELLKASIKKIEEGAKNYD